MFSGWREGVSGDSSLTGAEGRQRSAGAEKQGWAESDTCGFYPAGMSSRF